MNLRAFLCWTMIALLPASAVAAAGAAMAHPYGAAWLNGVSVEHASTIFPGDLVQTNPGSVLKIEAIGSSVTVLSDSLITFDGDSAAIKRGSAKLKTSSSMSAHAGIVTVRPASSELTEFQVTRATDTVQIVALKGDLHISNGTETTTLAQGQQATQTISGQDQKIAGVGAAVGGSKAASFAIGAATASATAVPVRVIEAAGKKSSVKKP
jgi:hypothetical protein